MANEFEIEADVSRRLAKVRPIPKDAYVLANGFPGIVRDGYVNRPSRMVEVWGIAHEMGSVYRSRLIEISKAQFEEQKVKVPSGHERPYRRT